MSKDQDASKAMDANQDVQPPPPSYAATSGGNTSYAPPTGAPPGDSYYQAQPVGGQTYASPGGYTPPEGPPSGHAPPAGPPSGYTPPAGPPSAYAPPAGPPSGYAPPPGTNTVIYVVDDPHGTGPTGPAGRGDAPVAMICFIFGICTWVGYLVGMCFINSPDPRERFWARACSFMAVIWALIIIFASIFGRHY
ncbi:hypothetical protein CPB97_000902 [Podila verticillata]|nr:hypothetical protein CPB97_000902 [Podila verticillata]